MKTYKKIPILENYEIDTLGNVRNIKTKRILKDRKSTDGYRQINLRYNKKQITYSIHRLVAITYIPNSFNFKCIDHIDRNRTNNKVLRRLKEDVLDLPDKIITPIYAFTC